MPEELIPYECQNVRSSNWQLTNYLDQNYTSVAIGSSTGYVPPPQLVNKESDLLHSRVRESAFKQETSEVRSDCYQYNGNRETTCNVNMNQFAGAYLPEAMDVGKMCSFKDAKFNCQNPFLISTSVPSQPQKLKHTVEPWVWGGINTRHYGRSSDASNRNGHGRQIKFSH